MKMLDRPRCPFGWSIYLIDNEDGTFYAGATRNVKRRMGEHRKAIGRKPQFAILQCGVSLGWRFVESEWIEKLRAAGIGLSNKTIGGNGVQTSTAETRAKARRGWHHSPETIEKIRAPQKGVPKQWSAEARKRVEATQLRPGHRAWDKLTDEQKAAHSARSRAQWERMPPEEKARILSDLRSMPSRTDEDARRRMREAQVRRWGKMTPEERSAFASRRAKEVSISSKAFWAKFTPEERSQILRERALKRCAHEREAATS